MIHHPILLLLSLVWLACGTFSFGYVLGDFKRLDSEWGDPLWSCEWTLVIAVIVVALMVAAMGPAGLLVCGWRMLEEAPPWPPCFNPSFLWRRAGS